MRKALIGFLLAATAAAPLAAQPSQDDDHHWRGSGRGEAHGGQGQRNQAQPAPQATPAPQAAPQARGNGRGQAGAQAQQAPNRWQDRGGASNQALRQQIEQSRAASQASAAGLSPHYQQKAAENQARYEQQLREQYRGRQDDRRDWQNRGDGQNGRQNWQGRNDWRGERGNGSRDWSRSWNRNWRQDHRYDWQRYRYSNRSIFHVGTYYSPYRGYGYRRFGIGLTLDPLFYGSNYWISDPFYYRLPAAPPGARWVRYYNDVLLVDMYSGQVVDVIYDFFW